MKSVDSDGKRVVLQEEPVVEVSNKIFINRIINIGKKVLLH